MSALLEIRDLVRRFPVKASGRFGARAKAKEVFAVDGVSFDIGEQQTLGLVGESGCGKSTLVRLIARLIDATSGTIRFDDADIGSIPAASFGRRPERAAIQMVFQDPTDSLNPRFTAFDCIADPIRRLTRSHGTHVSDRVFEVAGLCGLPSELLQRFPHQLSGGQKARVGISRALAVQPRLLILDEPTSALDVSVQVVILHLLADLRARLGLSYLFVSHDLNVVRLLCDHVIVMYAGKIVEGAPTRELFTTPRHPYSLALLSASPQASRNGRPRIRLTGEPISPINPDPDVCRFASRCPDAAERCVRSMPLLQALSPQHQVACHFPASVSSQGYSEAS